MGILEKTGWDLFFSYSSLDNRLNDGWIETFRDDLRERIGLLLFEKDSTLNLQDLAIFFDTESMPANGPLELELLEKVKASRFLVLFVGENYLRSEWCGKELQCFMQQFAGIEDQALKRIFMMMMTPDATRSAQANALFKNGIYQYAYITPDILPVAPKLPDTADILRDNPKYSSLVNKFAKTLVDRFLEAGLKISGAPVPVIIPSLIGPAIPPNPLSGGTTAPLTLLDQSTPVYGVLTPPDAPKPGYGAIDIGITLAPLLVFGAAIVLRITDIGGWNLLSSVAVAMTAWMLLRVWFARAEQNAIADSPNAIDIRRKGVLRQVALLLAILSTAASGLVFQLNW